MSLKLRQEAPVKGQKTLNSFFCRPGAKEANGQDLAQQVQSASQGPSRDDLMDCEKTSEPHQALPPTTITTACLDAPSPPTEPLAAWQRPGYVEIPFSRRRRPKRPRLDDNDDKAAAAAIATIAPPLPLRTTLPPPRLTRQLYLDLGQSSFGPSRCTSCGMLYSKGEPTDEKLHRLHHTTVMRGFSLRDAILASFLATRLTSMACGARVALLPLHASLTKPILTRTRTLCRIMDESIGLDHGTMLAPWMTSGSVMTGQEGWLLLYVSQKQRICGLAVMERVGGGRRREGLHVKTMEEEENKEEGEEKREEGEEKEEEEEDFHAAAESGDEWDGLMEREEEEDKEEEEEERGQEPSGPSPPFRAASDHHDEDHDNEEEDEERPLSMHLGVRGIWVAAECRRKGIATKLVDFARRVLIPGAEVGKDCICFYHSAAASMLNSGRKTFLEAYCAPHGAEVYV